MNTIFRLVTIGSSAIGATHGLLSHLIVKLAFVVVVYHMMPGLKRKVRLLFQGLYPFQLWQYPDLGITKCHFSHLSKSIGENAYFTSARRTIGLTREAQAVCVEVEG